ncbi:4-hydroxy-3-methylbut-2-enyl diphosphate reductase [Candidatus Woesearchaeota archaeon]|nr:4-hydroxy-3-methylbut-2-enyl diphosphate reductase [Candidatus Woesearchaeota archaeon]
MTGKIVLASPRGFCAGVERAIDVVEEALAKYGKPVYVKHQIVHNSHVIDDLSQKGAVFVESVDDVPNGSVVIFSAHGVPPSAHAEAAARNLRIIDATCPLVTKVHLEAKRYSREGYSILLVGHRGHVEVIGTSGEAPEVTQLVETVEDANKVIVPNPDKVVCLTQTTLSVDDTRKIVEALKARFPRLVFPPKEDICYATQNRQNAVKELAKGVGLVIVVGSKNSSNSNRLVEVARDLGVKAYLVNEFSEIDPVWLDNVDSVGITSGASVPDYLVQEVIKRLKESGISEVAELSVLKENTKFSLPRI